MALNLDINQLTDQFRGLNPNDPGSWPALPRAAAVLGVFALVLALGWFLYLSGLQDTRQAGIDQEEQLKTEYRKKIAQAVNLEALRQQKEEVTQYVNSLEKKLPSKAEMDALLSDINQAGVGRGLQFELFKPGQVVVKDYYAELPISIRISGRYHDLASFTGDVAGLSRIVTLNEISLKTNDKGGGLTMESVAKTFRYLDPEEVSAVRKAKQDAKAGVKK
ncbi:MAG: pilus assembly protein PilO [Burkholderiaceae bacterium]|nr:MAG: pilus assembly protein PilO [Burkholderiaceae bacterium]